MFNAATYTQRRNQLIQRMSSGLLLLMGNEESPMNYADNIYHFRQDSSFLYYFGLDHPNLNALIDVDSGACIIFGKELSIDDIVWTGPQPTLVEQAAKVGISKTAAPDQLMNHLAKAKQVGRTIHYLPPYRSANKIKLHQWLGIPLAEVKQHASQALIHAVIAQRSIKSEQEIAEIEKALDTTAAMHLAAMKGAKPGIVEAELTGQVHGIAVGGGGELAYPVILTVNGQTLHNHYHGNTLQSGQLVLGDFGAETAMHYAADITRTFPVDRQFTQQQKEIYQIVLDAEVGVIDRLSAQQTYLDMHLLAARIITDGLKALGLMKGDTDAAIAAGAHALFFPHGLGHMLGLDVHDMEDLGEDWVGYSDQIQRSQQFGLKSLRLGKPLEAGFVLTVEPGIYFIPELIDRWQAEGRNEAFINFAALDAYRNFGGIRIEDDVLIEAQGARVLGQAIPKTIAEVEAIRQSVV
ncbi:MAG: aminopeptidase P family protein [Bacteroidota bacterium]